jgi:pantoate--beta-alanine ligase
MDAHHAGEFLSGRATVVHCLPPARRVRDNVPPMIVVTTARDLARVSAPGGRRCAFVPTMGALHVGHAQLIRQGAELAAKQGLHDGCVVSIFINPTQFNDPADYDRYPKTLEADLAICDHANAAIVYVPERADIYPPGEEVLVPRLPEVATLPRLEDASRPGHFAGVCQVVRRLFDLVRPQVAIFGEKDWQQLQVIRAMTHDLRYPITILPATTVREPSGLAMSSRNRFLTPAQHDVAKHVSQALCDSWGVETPAAAEEIMRRILTTAGLDVEYAVIRDAHTLLTPDPSTKSCRALIAARLGSVRLLDNAPWRSA